MNKPKILYEAVYNPGHHTTQVEAYNLDHARAILNIAVDFGGLQLTSIYPIGPASYII